MANLQPGQPAIDLASYEQRLQAHPEQIPASIRNAANIDPALAIEGAPPNFGEHVVPHIATFAGIWSSAAHVYDNADEATRNSPENAEKMRLELAIEECLRARILAVAMMPWHIEPEDATSPKQREMAAILTRIVKRTPLWTNLSTWMGLRIWFGKIGAFMKYKAMSMAGEMRVVCKDWYPVHGDKVLMRFDDGGHDFEPGQLGIRVHAASRHLPRERIEYTQHGPAYFLRGYERNLFLHARHEIEDGPYAHPRLSNKVQGVGIRDKIYWTWLTMASMEQDIATWISRAAYGVRIWYYPMGDDKYKASIEASLKNAMSNGMADLMVPVPPSEFASMYHVDQIEPGTGGVEAVRNLIQNFYAKKIKRYILGQTVTSETDPEGIGGGSWQAKMAAFADILGSDARVLGECYTSDFLNAILLPRNFPESDAWFQFVIDTDDPKSEERMAAAKSLYEMDAPLLVDELYAITGFPKPTKDDEVLRLSDFQKKMQQAQQPPPGAADQGGMPPGAADGGPDGGGQPPMGPAPDDTLAPADMQQGDGVPADGAVEERNEAEPVANGPLMPADAACQCPSGKCACGMLRDNVDNWRNEAVGLANKNRGIIGEVAGINIRSVDGNLVKIRHDADFTEGSNFMVDGYVTKGEAWIDASLPVDQRKFVALHEAVEVRLMKDYGWTYDEAHEAANRVEMAARKAALPESIAGQVANALACKQQAPELLHGGKADGMPDSAFPPDELAKGIEHESEHTDDPAIAKEIAKDHIAETLDYYDRLEAIEPDETAEPAVAEQVASALESAGQVSDNSVSDLSKQIETALAGNDLAEQIAAALSREGLEAQIAAALSGPERYDAHDVSSEPRDESGQWTKGGSRFEPASLPHYMDVQKRSADLRIPREGESEEDIASYRWNERRARQTEKSHARDHVHLVDLPIDMLRVSEHHIAPERQARLDQIGPVDDPISVFIDHNMTTGAPILTVDDGNNRAEWRKRHGIKTIPAFVHANNLDDIEQLRNALAKPSKYSALPSDRISPEKAREMLENPPHGKPLTDSQRKAFHAAAEKYSASAADIKQAVKSWKEPSEAQKESGNYRKPRVKIHGLEIAIENPAGTKRNPEFRPLAHHYGYISRVTGGATPEAKDGDAVDVFVGDNPESEVVFVVDQETKAGRYDEPKVMIGFTNEADAKEGYLANYPSGWRCGPITAMTVDQFKAWLQHGDTTKRVADQVSRYSAGDPERYRLKDSPGQQGLFDSTAHPRAGSGEHGGQFVAKGQGTTAPAAESHHEPREPSAHDANEANVAAYQSGDREAATKLLTANKPLVYSIARKLVRNEFDLDDAVQEGNIAMLRAAKMFDPSQGVKFVTYAHRAITNAITRSTQKLKRGQAAGEDQGEDRPLERAAPEDESARPEYAEQIKGLHKALDNLHPKQADVIRRVFGIGYDQRQTMEEVADAYQVSRQRIQQVVQAGLDKLKTRHAAGVERFQADLDRYSITEDIERYKAKGSPGQKSLFSEDDHPRAPEGAAGGTGGQFVKREAHHMTRGEWHDQEKSKPDYSAMTANKAYWAAVEKALTEGEEVHPKAKSEFESIFGKIEPNAKEEAKAEEPKPETKSPEKADEPSVAEPDAYHEGKVDEHQAPVDSKGEVLESSVESPAITKNPFREQADKLAAKAERLHGGTSREKAMSENFPLGTGVPGNASSASTSRQAEARIDASIDRAKQAIETTKQANAMQAKAEAFDAGMIDEQGKPTEAAMAKAQEAKDRTKSANEKIADYMRATLNPGDTVYVNGNPIAVKRVNPTGITSEGGAKYSYNEIMPEGDAGAMSPKDLIDAMRQSGHLEGKPGPTDKPEPESTSTETAKPKAELTGLAGTLQTALTKEGLEAVKSARTADLGHIAENLHGKLKKERQASEWANAIKQHSRSEIRQALLDIRASEGVQESNEKTAGVQVALQSDTPTVSEIKNALGMVQPGNYGRWHVYDEDGKLVSQYADLNSKNAAVGYAINHVRRELAAKEGLSTHGMRRSDLGYKTVSGRYQSWLKSHGTSEDEVLGIDKAKAKAAAKQKIESASFNLASADKAVDGIASGRLSPDELRQSWKDFNANRETIRAELSSMSKDELAKRIGYSGADDPRLRAGVKKDDFVANAMARLAGNWRIDKGVEDEGRMEDMGGIYRKVKTPMDEWLADVNETHIAGHAEKIAKYKQEQEAARSAVAEAEAKKKAGAEKPETLEDFRNHAAKQGGYLSMTPENRRKWDEMEAEATKESRDAERARRAEIKQVQGEKVGFTLSKNRHEKRGTDIYTASPNARVDSATYSELVGKAKQLGGWYYKQYGNTPAGFHFPDEASRDKFVSLQSGDVDNGDRIAESESERKVRTATKLSDIAERLREDATERLNAPRQENTARRADMAAAATGQARKDIAFAETLSKLSDGIDKGAVKHLGGITAKTHVEELESMLNRGRWNYIRKARDVARTEGASQPSMESLEGEPIGEHHIDHVEYPYPWVRENALREAADAIKGKRGVSWQRQVLLSAADRAKESGGSATMKDSHEWEAMKAAVSKIKETDPSKHRWLLNELENAGTSMRRLMAAGITNEHELRAALREYAQFRGTAQSENPVRKAERALVGKPLPGFFPTPPDVIGQMLAQADIRQGHTVLEPSAGKGDIIDAIKEQYPETPVTAIEWNQTLKPVLTAKGHDVEYGDFLEHKGQYDRIVMNPPFENQQDQTHVKHAYEQLKPGGRLVAIMSAGGRNRDKFDQWLDDVGGTSTPLEQGSFNTSDAFRKTGVNVRMVVIDKPQ